jgi:hypothetical protein
MKYFDLDLMNGAMFSEWRNEPDYPQRRIVLVENDSVDLSYWNTYSVGINNNTTFQLLVYNYLWKITNIHGTKNFRTDNMTNNDFATMVECSAHDNNDWKTAHLTELYDYNPHWNFYNYPEYHDRHGYYGVKT